MVFGFLRSRPAAPKYDLFSRTGVAIDIPTAAFPTAEEVENREDLFVDSNCEHGWMQSHVSGVWLHYRKFVPANGAAPKSVVVWQHGIVAHSAMAFKLSSGRVTNSAMVSKDLVAKGHALWMLDAYGHGYSEGTRFFVPDWKMNRDDLNQFAHLAASQYPSSTPFFLMGESYGGCLALHLARHWQDQVLDPNSSQNSSPPPSGFRGLLLVCPAIIGDLPPAIVVWVLLNVFAPLFPRWTPFFMPNTLPAESIWSDPEVLALTEKENATGRRLDAGGKPFRLGTGAQLYYATEAVRRDAIPGLAVPYCVAHGTADYGVPMAGTDFLERQAATAPNDAQVHRIVDAYHGLLSEPTAEDTWSKLYAWLEGRLEQDPFFDNVEHLQNVVKEAKNKKEEEKKAD